MARGRDQKRQRRKSQRRAPVAQHTSRRPMLAIAGTVLLLAIVAIVYFATRGTHSATNTPTPSSRVAGSITDGQPVDGISCGALEQLAYHIHQHLSLYRNGKPVTVPSEIGILGGENNPTCFYWIHVHNFTPGIIHVESPVKKTLHLKNFFDVWTVTRADAVPRGDAYPQQLRAAARRHAVTVFLNGKRWTHGYATVPLTDHAVITVEIGRPVIPPKPYTDWSNV